jgi:lipoprotein-releasing system ATP-binding protein
MIKAKQIKKSFYSPVETKILTGIDFEAAPGETIAIMGRSGEGKSTFLNILGTLEDACAGELYIADQKVSHNNKNLIRRKHIGFIFQSFHLLDDFTVLENILFPAYISREAAGPDTQVYKTALEMLNIIGLSDRAEFLTKQLSGGEKQRVAIARALCNNPDVILADEPTGNLDAVTASQVHSLLLSLAKDRGKTLIIVTHDSDLADLCSKKYFLHNGLLEREGGGK